MKRNWIFIMLLGLLTACGSEEEATVNEKEYKKLKNGMSIEEVKEIVGGKEKSKDEAETFVQYEFKGEKGVSNESSVSLLFSKDDKLHTIIEDGLLTESEPAATDTVVEEAPDDDLNYDITTGIEDKLGATNTDKERIVKLEINDHMGTDNTDDKIVLVTLRGNENLTDKMTKKGLLKDTTDVFEILFESRIVEEATVFWQLPLVDKKGNESEENVMEITLTKKTYDEINWENFDYNNFKDVADGFEQHSALK